MKERAHDLRGVGDAHILPDDSAIARDPLRALRPHERLRLCDEGSLQLIRSEVTSERMGDTARAGDGVIGARRGSAGGPCSASRRTRLCRRIARRQHADTILRIQRLAARLAFP